MKIAYPAIVIGLLAVGCAAKQKTSTSGENVEPGPPVEHLVVSTAKSPLRLVEVRYGDSMGRLDIETTITPHGLLRSTRTQNKAYGNESKVQELVEIREGHLTSQQMNDLAKMFSGWEQLSADKFIPIPDAPGITIRYAEHGKQLPVAGGMANQVGEIYHKINELAASMPLVPVSATQPALLPIDVSYISPMEHLDIHTTISADGVLSYIHKSGENVEKKEAHLNREEMADLARMFNGWDNLTTKGLVIINDGPGITVRYGNHGKTLPVALGMPRQTFDVYDTIKQLTDNARPIDQ